MTTYHILVCFIHSPRLAMRVPLYTVTLEKLKEMQELNIDIEIIKDFEPGTLEADMENVKKNVLLDNPKTGQIFDHIVRNLHMRQVSQAYKHKEALRLMASSEKYDALLVLEDDTLAIPDIKKALKDSFDTLINNKHIDILCLSSPVTKSESIKSNITPLFDNFKVLPVSDAYLVSKKASKLLDAEFFPLRFTTSVHLSYLAYKLNLQIYLHWPNIFANGSKFGVFLSNLDMNNQLFMNPDYNKLIMINAKSSIESIDKDTVDDLLKNALFKEHPDFQFQIALYNQKIGNIVKAKEIFDATYQLYIENDCLFGKDSEFLLSYARIHKHFQTL